MAGKDDPNAWLVGQNIRRIRKEKGMSQLDLALAMDTDNVAISRWENGTRSISIDSLFRLAGALDISPCVLIEKEEDQRRDDDINQIHKMLDMLPGDKRDFALQAFKALTAGLLTEM